MRTSGLLRESAQLDRLSARCAPLVSAASRFSFQPVTPVALGRVADLMQEEHALKPSVNVTALAREMTSP